MIVWIVQECFKTSWRHPKESDTWKWDYIEFWWMIQIRVIKEACHSTHTKKSEDQKQKQRCGNEHCARRKIGLVSCFVNVCCYCLGGGWEEGMWAILSPRLIDYIQLIRRFTSENYKFLDSFRKQSLTWDLCHFGFIITLENSQELPFFWVLWKHSQ